MFHYLYHLSYFIIFIHFHNYLILQFIFLLNILIIISHYKSNLFNYVNLLKSYNKYKYLIIIFYIIFKFLIHFLLLIISILIIIHLFYNIKYLI